VGKRQISISCLLIFAPIFYFSIQIKYVHMLWNSLISSPKKSGTILNVKVPPNYNIKCYTCRGSETGKVKKPALDCLLSKAFDLHLILLIS